MTKDECAKMCDSLKCTPEEKAMCMSHFGPDGKFIGGEMKACCKDKNMCEKKCEDKASCNDHHQ